MCCVCGQTLPRTPCFLSPSLGTCCPPRRTLSTYIPVQKQPFAPFWQKPWRSGNQLVWNPISLHMDVEICVSARFIPTRTRAGAGAPWQPLGDCLHKEQLPRRRDELRDLCCFCSAVVSAQRERGLCRPAWHCSPARSKLKP